jgi:hypothetical protein
VSAVSKKSKQRYYNAACHSVKSRARIDIFGYFVEPLMIYMSTPKTVNQPKRKCFYNCVKNPAGRRVHREMCYGEQYNMGILNYIL